jgi:hypothetical protein
MQNDPVNHPSHYCLGGIEVLDAIEAWELPYHLGNVVKYVARAGKKNSSTYLQDLQKAQFYLNRFVSQLKDKREAGSGLLGEKRRES